MRVRSAYLVGLEIGPFLAIHRLWRVIIQWFPHSNNSNTVMRQTIIVLVRHIVSDLQRQLKTFNGNRRKSFLMWIFNIFLSPILYIVVNFVFIKIKLICPKKFIYGTLAFRNDFRPQLLAEAFKDRSIVRKKFFNCDIPSLSTTMSVHIVGSFSE